MKRVMCVWFPNWPLQRIRYAQPEHKHRTLVLFADAGRSGLQVVACCHAAAKREIVRGMPLAEARGVLDAKRNSRCDVPVFLQHEPEADRIGLHGLAVWCQRFSPIVGIEEPDSLLLDLSGCAALFGGERQLSSQLARSLSRWNFTVRTAIADTIGTAWAIARFGKERAAVVPPGEQETLLRLLPVQSLRLPPAVVETLGELDVRRIEQLLALPRASLPARVGPEVARRLDQALGSVIELIVPVRPSAPVAASQDFEYPLRDRQTLRHILRQLVERIAEQVARIQQGVQRLEVRFVSPTKRTSGFTIGMLRPSHVADHLMELVETRLEQWTLTDEVAGLQLEATTTALLQSHQHQLFSNGRHPHAERELAQLIDRLSSRLGKQRVVRPRVCPEAQPELSVSWEPVLDANSNPQSQPLSHTRFAPIPARPLRLRTEPLAVDVVSIVPDGPPIRIVWKQNKERVIRHWGPERIETGWWRGQHIRRDYYRVETEGGGHFWLFRQIGQGDWFLHGEFE